MSKLEEFEDEAKEIAESCAGKGSGSGSKIDKGIENVQIPQPDGTTKPPAPGKDHKGKKFALRHGGFSYLRTGIVPGCHLCILRKECDQFTEDSKECILISEMQADLIQGIMSLAQIKSEDIVLVEELARTKTFLWIVDKWLSVVGPFNQEKLRTRRALEAQAILKQRWTAANSMSRICEQLGLSPMSRARLKLGDSPFDLAKAIHELDQEAGGQK